MCVSLALLIVIALADRPIPDFTLRNSDGTDKQLAAAPGRPTVIVFLGVDCPIANLYVPRLKELAARNPNVSFFAVNPNDHDTIAEMAGFCKKYALTFPYLKDADGRVALAVGATRTPEVVVLDADRRVRYRGRIDDQFAAGSRNRNAPTRNDLAEALRELTAGQPISVPVTIATGCLISRPESPKETARFKYHRDIAPILAAHCQACHSPGQIGPFPLTTFAEARSHARMIAEVVEAGTMPPWHASPKFGQFRNDRRLSESQKKLLAEWVRLGCPDGEEKGSTPARIASTGWDIGTPDAVFPISSTFHIPAEGVIEYQHFVVDPGFTTDTWVTAAEVRPQNRRVVHHCNVFLRPPDAVEKEDLFETGSLGSINLVAFTPGSGPMLLPPGMAKKIPAGWRLHFILHYTPIGSPATDRTELGLRFLEASEVRKEVATKLLIEPDLAIPPHAAAYRVEKTWIADRDYLLLSMFPHMHLRGKSFRYTAEYPDGTSEILLDVPEYDFNWQHRYELAEPKRLPAGTTLRCEAVFDNSAGNRANPDPNATVRAGQQSWDEMFNGYFDIALADQDLPAERATAERSRVRSSAIAFVAASLAAGWWFVRIRRK